MRTFQIWIFAFVVVLVTMIVAIVGIHLSIETAVALSAVGLLIYSLVVCHIPYIRVCTRKQFLQNFINTPQDALDPTKLKPGEEKLQEIAINALATSLKTQLVKFSAFPLFDDHKEIIRAIKHCTSIVIAPEAFETMGVWQIKFLYYTMYIAMEPEGVGLRYDIYHRGMHIDSGRYCSILNVRDKIATMLIDD